MLHAGGLDAREGLVDAGLDLWRRVLLARLSGYQGEGFDRGLSSGGCLRDLGAPILLARGCLCKGTGAYRIVNHPLDGHEDAERRHGGRLCVMGW